MSKIKSSEITNKSVSRQLELMENFDMEKLFLLNEYQAGYLFDWIRKTYGCEGFDDIFRSKNIDMSSLSSEGRLEIVKQHGDAMKAGQHMSYNGQIRHEASSVFIYLPASENTSERLINVFLYDINGDRCKFEPNAVTYYIGGEVGNKRIDKITTGLKDETEIILDDGKDIFIMEDSIDKIMGSSPVDQSCM